MIDTHTHLYPSESFPDTQAFDAIDRAITAGVTTMILPCVDPGTIRPIIETYERYPKNIRIALGIHPTEITPSWVDDLRIIEPLLTHPGITAIGEIGIDLYWDTTKKDMQIQAFRAQLILAAHHKLPVIIHQRSALTETLDVLSSLPKNTLQAIPTFIFHCFTEGPDSVRRIREIIPDALFGIGGVSTFKNAKDLHKAIPEIGLNHILLETDSPYLAPVPHRGHRNESAYLPLIANHLSTLLPGTTPAQIAAATTRTAQLLLNPLH